MRIGELEIEPVSGRNGTLQIEHELVAVNGDLDKRYIIAAVCGNVAVNETVKVEGKYDVMIPSDGPVLDRDGFEMWVPKAH